MTQQTQLTQQAPTPLLTEKDQPLWTPTPELARQTQLAEFMHSVGQQDFPDYHFLWVWSVKNPGAFWSAVWDFCGVIGEKGAVLLHDGRKMPGAQFFPQARLNYAENLLRRRDSQTALIFHPETGAERSLSFTELYDRVSRWAQALKGAGVQEGDRVAGYMPNMPETIIAMLAASSLGAVWSSASPDFGVQGVLDRFGQIEPTVLIGVDAYFYSGKMIDCLSKVRDVQCQLPGLKTTVIVPFVSDSPDLAGLTDSVREEDFIAPYVAEEIAFARLPFNHPLFIMFSSGTTGAPKCIVHGQGGTLIQHLKEHRLHCDIRPADRVFYFTTCGWMMWNWLVSALASKATLLLYDGSPFHPDGHVLWEFATKHQCTLFGTSAKYIDALKINGLRPGDTHDVSALRTITSTGSPLVHESFDFVYDAIKRDVHLASIAGGTDLISCFMLGNPISPVWRGEIQEAGLGMALAVFGEEGLPIPTTMVGRPYSSPEYEPLWAALEEIGLPVSIHIGTTGEPIYDRFLKLGIGVGVVNAKIVTGELGMAELIWAGIPQRYPKLRFIIAEAGIGWIPTVLGFMDHWWGDHRLWMEPQLEEAPSFYFNRQFWATFEEDRAGIILAREGLLPMERLMWGSDYPHTEGTFPHSQQAIAKDFSGLPEADMYKLVVGNAAQLYELN